MKEHDAVPPFTTVYCRQAANLSYDFSSFSCGHLLSPMNFIKPPRPPFSAMMEREPCELLRTAATQPLPISFSSLGSQRMPPPTPTNNSRAGGDRGAWVAAWQGCVHGNRSACGEQKVAGVLGVVPSSWAAHDPTGAAFPALVRVCSCSSLTPLFLSFCCLHLQTIARS